VGGHVDGQVEDQGERQLRHRLGGVAGDVGHGDAAGAGGGEVDDVGAGGADAHVAQLRERREGLGADHRLVGDDGLGAAGPLDDGARGGPGMDHQLAQAGQGLPGVVLSLIGGEAVQDDDAHEGPQFSGIRLIAKPP
jgi:hypothetical protein